ncbi:SulP family inorganic anion transporter [Anaerobaca lacustris]|uniref:Sulfate permease n=1 Tax=Anaerobaca lacustris TaxID=3044600 RepID=A0AAW6U136_9BACT|nr:sulfate permease [Sedimentisphaerales bacterium M17dextr]
MLRLVRLLPPWLIHPNRDGLRDDLIAGSTIAVMLVPQAMAYAMLAGLPPVVGLYASTLPLLTYALLGSSRQLAVGPVAIISLMVFTACAPLAQSGTTDYVALVLLLTIMIGFIQFVAGLLRLGFVVNFFSQAVISGFTSAAAIVIALSQMKHLLGIQLGTEKNVFKLVAEIARHAPEANGATLALGAASVAGLWFLKKRFPHFPSAILFVVVGTLLSYFGLSKLGVETVGAVPRGLPGFTMPRFSLDAVRHLVPAALAICFVGYMESISVAKYVAARAGHKIDPNRELLGLGAANLVASLFSGYPVTGGLSRTAVAYQAGARTQRAAVMTSVLILLTLLLLTPLFYYLPKAVLSAIIVVAVGALLDYKEAVHLFRIKRADGLTFLLTFVCTLAIGIEQGLLIGLVFSLGLFIWRSSHPHTAELGYLESEGVFRNVLRHPEAKVYPGTLILRPDASLYFANTKFLEDCLAQDVAGRPGIRWIVLDMSGVNDIDAVAVDVLEKLVGAYRHRGIEFAFAAMKGPVRDVVKRAGWEEKQGHVHYPSLQHALRGIRVLGDSGGDL